MKIFNRPKYIIEKDLMPDLTYRYFPKEKRFFFYQRFGSWAGSYFYPLYFDTLDGAKQMLSERKIYNELIKKEIISYD